MSTPTLLHLSFVHVGCSASSMRVLDRSWHSSQVRTYAFVSSQSVAHQYLSATRRYVPSLPRWPPSSCRLRRISVFRSSWSITRRIGIFLLARRNRCWPRTRNFNVFPLNFLNSLLVIPAGLAPPESKYVAIAINSLEYPSSNAGASSIGSCSYASAIGITRTRTESKSASMKSSISC
jgi:hypothetical protein